MERSVVFSVHDMKLYPITDPGDDATDPTYGTAVDVPGISEVELSEEITEAILRGDGKVIDTRTVLESLSLSFTYGMLSPSVLAVLDGGTAETGAAGTGGEGITRYVRNADDLIPAWGFACLVSEVTNPGGAAKVYGYNSKINGGTLFGATDNEHGEPAFDARITPIPVGALFAVDLEDTGTALPADGTELIATYGALPAV